MKTKVVYSQRLATRLREKGFRIVDTQINKKYPQYDVYLFEDTPEFQEAFENEIYKGV